MPFLDPEELKPKLREVFETVVIPQIKKAKMKQTAVETLIEIYYGNEGQLTIKDFEQAKEMEKEQKNQMYNEIEVLQLLLKLHQTESFDNLKEWFEQNKKITFKSE